MTQHVNVYDSRVRADLIVSVRKMKVIAVQSEAGGHDFGFESGGALLAASLFDDHGKTAIAHLLDALKRLGWKIHPVKDTGYDFVHTTETEPIRVAITARGTIHLHDLAPLLGIPSRS